MMVHWALSNQLKAAWEAAVRHVLIIQVFKIILS